MASRCGGIHAANLAKWNSISVLLSCGLIVDYLHVMPGCAQVQVGDHVQCGQVLGESGDIGFAPEPHLHVEVHRSDDPEGPSVPVRFGASGFVPVAGSYYISTGEVPAPHSEDISPTSRGAGVPSISKSRRRLQRLERQKRSQRSSQSSDAQSVARTRLCISYDLSLLRFSPPPRVPPSLSHGPCVETQVTVHFAAEGERWTHDFEVPQDAQVRELKAGRHTARRSQEVDSPSIGSVLDDGREATMLNPPGTDEERSRGMAPDRLLGRRVPDFEKITQDTAEDCDLDFEFLGPVEGERKARRDKADEPHWAALQLPQQEQFHLEPPFRDKSLMKESRPSPLRGPMSPVKRWEVIGGADKGGILVREGQSTTSKQLAERLSTGAFVEELDLRGERLNYKRLTGTGPEIGLTVSGKAELTWQKLAASRLGYYLFVVLWYQLGLEIVKPSPMSPEEMLTSAAQGSLSGHTSERFSCALSLQEELMEGFGKPEFQKALAKIIQEHPSKTGSEFMRKRNELFLTVQSIVLPRYGFEGSPKAVTAGPMGTHQPHFYEKRVADEKSVAFIPQMGGSTEEARNCDFVHPGELPVDPDLARRIQDLTGPEVAQISRATVLDHNAGIVLIERQDGRKEEVPKSRILHWFEGVLILQAIKNSKVPVGWMTRDFETVLTQQMARMSSLSYSINYVEQRLLNEAVTGSKFIDLQGVQHNFRRRGLLEKEKENRVSKLVSGGDIPSGFWKIKTLSGYMPPWEAFHEFSLYQDFYLVLWDTPYERVDYAKEPNGCGLPSATWEPDECLPPHLDELRLREKRSWIQRKRAEAEAPELRNGEKRKASHRASHSEPLSKLRRWQRDMSPLCADMFQFKLGHDFKPELLPENIREGWPKRPQEYPKGYGCADPPGFCHERCDCMDDGRPQQPWETHKHWLEDSRTSRGAAMAIEHLSAQSTFVRRRGQVTNMHHHFETLKIYPYQDPHKAAYDEIRLLAELVQTLILQAMQEVPLRSLFDRTDQVRIPIAAFRLENDYVPLKFLANHSWLSVGVEDGLLMALADPPHVPFQVKVTAKTACCHDRFVDEVQRPVAGGGGTRWSGFRTWLEAENGLVQKPQNFVDAVEISEAVETKVQRLPDLVGQYPVRFSDGARLETGLVRQAWSTLEAARDFCFDAMCISLRRRSV
ncbi:unnamed protein product [Durusdinium trenchii]|uniref:Protein C10 n=1 Tax=Durusdinium trenchii TaxID=1381693 RepID=A0ABP0MFG4_9DINO